MKVTGTRAGFDPVTKESGRDRCGRARRPDDPHRSLVFSGSAPKVGITFTAIPGTWDSGVTFTYQWTAEGTYIAGADGRHLHTVGARDFGKAIADEVTAAKTGYNSVTKTSPPRAPRSSWATRPRPWSRR